MPVNTKLLIGVGVEGLATESSNRPLGGREKCVSPSLPIMSVIVGETRFVLHTQIKQWRKGSSKKPQFGGHLAGAHSGTSQEDKEIEMSLMDVMLKKQKKKIYSNKPNYHFLFSNDG